MGVAARIVTLIDANTKLFNTKLDMATAKTAKLGTGLVASSRSFSTFTSSAIAAGLALGGAFKLTGVINEVDRAMHESLAIMGDVSEQIKGKMLDTAAEVAKGTKFSMAEAGKAYFFLASAGMDAAQSLAAMPAVAEFAQAGNFDLAKATDLVTDAQMAMGLSSKNAQKNLRELVHVSDVLVGANTLANASVEQFSEALTNKAAAAGRMYGQSLEDVVAVLAVFAQRGIKGVEAGTQYDIVMRNLAIKAVQNEAAFKKYNIAIYDQEKKFRALREIVRDIDKAFADLAPKEVVLAKIALGFTAKTISSTNALAGTADAMDAFYESLNKMDGKTKEVSEKTLTEFDKGLQKLSGSFTHAAKDSQSFTDAMGGLLGAMGAVIDAGKDEQFLPKIRRFVTGERDPQLDRGRTSGPFAPFIDNAPAAINAVDHTSDAVTGLVNSTNDANAAADKLAKGLEFDISTHGMDAIDKQIEKLRAAGAGPERIARLELLKKELDAENKKADKARELQRQKERDVKDLAKAEEKERDKALKATGDRYRDIVNSVLSPWGNVPGAGKGSAGAYQAIIKTQTDQIQIMRDEERNRLLRSIDKKIEKADEDDAVLDLGAA